MFFIVLVLAALGTFYLVVSGFTLGERGALTAFFVAVLSLGGAVLLASLNEPVGANWVGLAIGVVLGGGAFSAAGI